MYAFTREGSFIAWLVEAYHTKDDKVRCSEATAAVFDILASYLRHDGSSFAQFVSLFIDKLRQENILHILIEHNTYELARLVLQQDLRLAREVFPAIAHVGIVPTRIFKEAFKELSETTQRLLLFQFKMDIESNYRTWELTKEWEEMRYKHRNDLSKVTLLGHCHACQSTYPFVLDMFEFFGLPDLFLVNPYIPGRHEPKIDCLKCDKSKSLSIKPIWIGGGRMHYFVTKEPLQRV